MQKIILKQPSEMGKNFYNPTKLGKILCLNSYNKNYLAFYYIYELFPNLRELIDGKPHLLLHEEDIATIAELDYIKKLKK